MSLEKIFSLFSASEICKVLNNNELDSEEKINDACLALEFRLRVKKDYVPRGTLLKVQQFLNKGIELRKNLDDDAIYANFMGEYEKNVGPLVNNRCIQQIAVNATTNTPSGPSVSLGSKAYNRTVPNSLKRHAPQENKTTHVKEVPRVLPNVNREISRNNSKYVIDHLLEGEKSLIDGNIQLSNKRKRSDNENNFEKIEVLDTVEEYFDNFNYKNKKVKVKILPVPENKDMSEWIHGAISEVCVKVKEGVLPGDLVCLSIINENSPERPIYTNARTSKTLVPEVVMNSFQKVCQSNQDFLVSSALTFELHHIEMPIGKSHNKRYINFGLNRSDWSKLKSSVVQVKNEGNDCLAYALVLAIAKHEETQASFNSLSKRQESRKMKKRVQDLLQSSKVNLQNGGGMHELKQFQGYLKDYKIIVYNSRDGSKVFFDDSNYKSNKKLILYLENNHYDVITNTVACFGFRQFCEVCHSGSQDSHPHRCNKACSRCRHSPICSKDEKTIVCDACNRKFHGTECYKKHFERAVDMKIACDFLKQCPDCDTTYQVDAKKRVHKCNEVYCKNCYDYKSSDHLCYIKCKPQAKNFIEMVEKTRYCFFDLECTQDKRKSGKVNTFIHEPNLCVSQVCCYQCMNSKDKNNDSICVNCGPRQKIFFGGDVVGDFLNYLVEPNEKFNNTVILSHSGGSYDLQFVLKTLLENEQRFTDPELILNGTKIMSMKVNNLKFLDSLNFMPMALEKLPGAFDLKELKKGYFPHLFNIKDNIEYNGPIVPEHFFTPDSMSVEKREKFKQWYIAEKAKSEPYCFKQQLIDYCVSDVTILREACLKFRELLLTEGNIDCFIESYTIASACNLVFRRKYLQPDLIGLVPTGGYRWRDNQSKEAIEWLVWLEHELGHKIEHAAHGQERKLLGRKVDGYHETIDGKKIIYQYHGCYYHGCQRCYQDSDQPLTIDPLDTMAQRRERTDATRKKFESRGFVYIEKWGCQFKEDKENNANIQKIIDASHLCKKDLRLDPRNAFKGGRTNAIKLYYKCKPGEKIRYADFTSLYPFVNKYMKYPIGHPKIFVYPNCPSLEESEGFCCATVIPPKQLFFPVLPYSMHGKLMFFLCKTCAENCLQESCAHKDEERMFTGTWTSDELKKAVECGYKIAKMHEIWQYETATFDPTTMSGGVLSMYIQTFLKIKQESSGWPKECVTEEKKLQYLDEYYRKEGIHLDRDKIEFNAGRRSLAKLMLNSLWGKFGQRNNLKQHIIVSSAQEMYAKISEPGVIINSIKMINTDKMLIVYEYECEAVSPLNHVSVAIAAYTTAHARLHLYTCLQKLGARILYMDTDSLIYSTLDGVEVDLPTGNFLGELTNELLEYGEDAYITEFVSGGPKNYAYKVYSPSKNVTKCVMKVKGITMNYGNRDIVCLEKLKDMILNDSDPIHVRNPCKIMRTADHDVITTEQSKIYRVVYTKRRMLPNCYDTLPFGYVDDIAL